MRKCEAASGFVGVDPQISRRGHRIGGGRPRDRERAPCDVGVSGSRWSTVGVPSGTRFVRRAKSPWLDEVGEEARVVELRVGGVR